MRCGSSRCRICLSNSLGQISGRATDELIRYFAWRASGAGGGKHSLFMHTVASAPAADYADLRDPDYRAQYRALVFSLLTSAPIYDILGLYADRLRAVLPAAGVDPAHVDGLVRWVRSAHAGGNADRRADLNGFTYAALRGWVAALKAARDRAPAAESLYRELNAAVPNMPRAGLGSHPRLLQLRRALARNGGLGYGGGAVYTHLWRFTRGLESAYWSPHWHFIVDGFISGRQVKRLHSDTGLAIVNLSSFGSLARLAHLNYYLGSHAAVARRRPILAYFGLARHAFHSSDIMSGALSGFDDIESLVNSMLSTGDHLTAARRRASGETVPGLYDRADLLEVEVQDVVIPAARVEASKRLPVARVAPNGMDI